MWSRVFSLTRDPVSPAALAGHLHALGLRVEPHFKGDDLGWTAGRLVLPGGGTPVYLDRFLTAEDDIRADLNTFAAELELLDFSPHSGPLMRHVIQTQQMLTLRKPVDHPDEATLERLVRETCMFLAAPDGVFQSDGHGWFTADGTLLIEDY